ncbi:acetolactate synthase [Artemisia annua]|uniref:Acetolactate synthase n=1 Tax=Artemisia annua TaxID=35608 RepID=A0A2U1PFR2_ARTAN|nr:acetolactate synthase [Artemisia annua]
MVEAACPPKLVAEHFASGSSGDTQDHISAKIIRNKEVDRSTSVKKLHVYNQKKQITHQFIQQVALLPTTILATGIRVVLSSSSTQESEKNQHEPPPLCTKNVSVVPQVVPIYGGRKASCHSSELIYAGINNLEDVRFTAEANMLRIDATRPWYPNKCVGCGKKVTPTRPHQQCRQTGTEQIPNYRKPTGQWEDQFYKANRTHTYLGDPSKEAEIFPNMLGFADACGIPAAQITIKEDLRPAIQRKILARFPKTNLRELKQYKRCMSCGGQGDNMNKKLMGYQRVCENITKGEPDTHEVIDVWSSACWQSSLTDLCTTYTDGFSIITFFFIIFFYPCVTFTSCSIPRRFENRVKFESGKIFILCFFIYFIPVHMHLCVFNYFLSELLENLCLSGHRLSRVPEDVEATGGPLAQIISMVPYPLKFTKITKNEVEGNSFEGSIAPLTLASNLM